MLCSYESRGKNPLLPRSCLLVTSKLLQNGGNLTFLEANFVELKKLDFAIILFEILNIFEKTRKIRKVFIFRFLPVFSEKIQTTIIT